MTYNWKIYDSIKNYYRENEGREITEQEIDQMSKYEVLDTFLEWEGIIGYTDAIGSLINDLFDIRKEEN